MKIFFDFEFDEKISPPFYLNNPVYSTLRDFLATRYKVLEDEINKIFPPPFVVVSIDPDNGSLTIHKWLMPSDLSKKIKECVTQEDFKYVADLVRRIQTGE